MKRLFVLALIVFGLVAAQTASSAGDAQGPPCANITNGDGGYNSAGVLDFTVSLQAPACSFVTYSFFVTDTDGNLLASTICTPDTPDQDCLHYVYNLGTSGPATVCVYATTDIHGHLADRAPDSFDSSCPTLSSSLSLAKGGAGASGTFG